MHLFTEFKNKLKQVAIFLNIKKKSTDHRCTLTLTRTLKTLAAPAMIKQNTVKIKANPTTPTKI